MDKIEQLFKELNISFDVKPLVKQAFNHSTFFYENPDVLGSNERLEFMGDAIMELWTSSQLYNNNDLDEGKMTIIRSQFVREQSFCQLALQLNLDKYLKLGVGEEKMGGRKKPSILADLFEAFVGALYLEYGIEFIFEFLDENFKEVLNEYDADKGPKTKLQEYAQADKRNNVIYEVKTNDNGEFSAIVYLNKIALGQGSGKTKKDAEQSAATAALKKLVR